VGQVEDNGGTAVGIAAGIAVDVDSIHYFGSRTYHSVVVVEYILGSENDVKIDLKQNMVGMVKMSCKKYRCDSPVIPLGKYCEIHRISKKMCIELGCKKNAQGVTDKCVEHGGGKRCVESGCKKSAASPSDKCKKHGGGKRCVEPNCKKSAQSASDKCVEHGGGKRCVEPNCKKSARSASDKCIEHGGGKRCIESGCKKSAQSPSDKCVEHGGGKRCVESGCKKSAASPSDKCVEHGGGKRCVESGCKKSAVGASDKCVEHGGGKRCVESGCKKSAVGASDKCKAHGGGKRCPHCIDWIDSRCGDSNYDGYCATCFKRLFPDDPHSTRVYSHSKEIQVRNAITEYSTMNPLFAGFVHDRPLYTGNCDCTHRRRVDHRKLIGNTILAVETDEFAHRGYDEKDEEIRYDDLYMIHSGKWIYIRFNPDNTHTQYADIEDRITVLLETMEQQIHRIEEGDNTDLVEIIKLYY
jgi:hypothetical protein